MNKKIVNKRKIKYFGNLKNRIYFGQFPWLGCSATIMKSPK